MDWGAREPRGLENFPIPATVGVMGHHTAWDRCYTKEECSKEVRKIQAFHMGPEGNATQQNLGQILNLNESLIDLFRF